MPKEIHKKLEKQAKKKGLSGKKKDAYVFGTLFKIEKAKKDTPRARRRTTGKRKPKS